MGTLEKYDKVSIFVTVLKVQETVINPAKQTIPFGFSTAISGGI
jgi:hypothetical protein